MLLFFSLSAIISIIGISCIILSAKTKDGQMIIPGIVLIIISQVFYSLGLIKFISGYPAFTDDLQANEVCEMVYTTPTINNSHPESPVYITLIQLSDGQFRLFKLNKEPVKGTVKVQNDYSLRPFPVIPSH